MNIDQLWTSPANAPAPGEAETWVRDLLEELRRARRRRVAFLVWTFIALAAVTGLVAYAALVQPSELTAAPALVVLLAAQWSVFAFLLRQWLKARRPTQGTTVRESVETLYRDAADAARRSAVVLCLQAGALPVVWIAIAQLQASGKMAPHEASSATVVLSGALVIAAGAVAFWRYRIALPRRARLEATLRQYRDE